VNKAAVLKIYIFSDVSVKVATCGTAKRVSSETHKKR